MEKEQIIKALECCTRTNNVEHIPCPDCPYNEYNRLDGTTERHKSKCCDWWLMVDALALIKQQDEQIFQLENRLKECENGYAGTLHLESCKLHDAEEKVKELTEENERLRAIPEQLHKEMSERMLEERKIERKLAVREMQTRFAMHFGTYRPTDEVKVIEVFKLLKKISEEMLYEKTEEEEK